MSVLTEKADVSLQYVSLFNELKSKLNAGSHEILNSLRNRAFQDFVKQGIPTRKNENYKYTNLQPAFGFDYQVTFEKPQTEVASEEIFRCDVPQLDTHHGILLNGWFANNEQSAELPSGVIFESLEIAAIKYADLIKKHYGTLAETAADPIVALNTAFANDGYFLYVPKNVVFEKPLQIISLLKSENDTFCTSRNLVIVEQGAKAQIILCNHTLNLNRYLSNSATEVFVEENAQFEYYNIQNQHNNSTLLNSVFVKQESNSVASVHTVSLHGGLIRNNLKVTMNGENGEANLFGLAFPDKKQHTDNFIQIEHAKPHCQSNQLFKYVLNDNSTGAFSGKIHVARDAQKTNAFQRNNNLLLTDTASMQTKPQLIIDADDVKCSHGATVGQIDEQALFYLRSRGIEENMARLMMMNAFAHEVVQEIKVEALRERIDELIEKRLSGDVARCHECNYKCECS